MAVVRWNIKALQVMRNSESYCDTLNPDFSHLSRTPTNARTYIFFYITTFKIAPTCFDPKIIFRELNCSLLSHIFKNTH